MLGVGPDAGNRNIGGSAQILRLQCHSAQCRRHHETNKSEQTNGNGPATVFHACFLSPPLTIGAPTSPDRPTDMRSIPDTLSAVMKWQTPHLEESATQQGGRSLHQVDGNSTHDVTKTKAQSSRVSLISAAAMHHASWVA